MGLSIAVGMLADIKKHDPEAVPDFQEEFQELNAVLQAHGFPRHDEPLEVEPWHDPLELGDYPYSWIHYLRRFQAYHLAGKTAPPMKKDENPSRDPILDHPATQQSHLIQHSDAEGYYLPIDFKEAIVDETLMGGAVGSSQRLLAELCALAPKLGFKPQGDLVPEEQIEATLDLVESEGPLHREKAIWIVLFDAANASIRNKAAIYFC